MKIGSLFTGYGGLDMALAGEVAWYAEIEPAACRVLEAHHGDIPNLRDVTSIDWADVSPVDVLTAGYPCQPFSQAGKRQGSGDERHLWPYVATAIDALRPGLVVLENVRGHLTLGFGDVLADLSRLGYDARWGVVRASDAGAPHHRARVFIVVNANNAGWRKHRRPIPNAQKLNLAQYVGGVAADACCERHGSGEGSAVVGCVGGSTESSGWQTSTTWEKLGAGGAATASNTEGIAGRPRLNQNATIGKQGNSQFDWGTYEPAIRRWERLTRPAPAPTIPKNNGQPRLSPIFVEWMMGLPEGWVTGHGLSSSQCLKMLGNGVVPQQAALALRLLTRSL